MGVSTPWGVFTPRRRQKETAMSTTVSVGEFPSQLRCG